MFNPREHLAVAVRLAPGARDEATQRLVINRAYYAAFLVVRGYFEQRGGVPNPPRSRRLGSHERVIFSVGTVSDPSAGAIRRALLRLKKLRVSADYDLGYAGARQDVAKAITYARRIIAWIDALP